jgi:hydrogenase small subunit
MDDQGLYAALIGRGMTRRSFLKFSSAMAAALALPASFAPRIARAVEAAPKLPVIWVRGQTCGGNTEAVLRGYDPTVSTLLLDTLSIEYHESFLATAGTGAGLALQAAMERYPNGYVAVLEGAIPAGDGAGFCLVGGRPVADVAREVCSGATATIAVGSCAFDGGIAAADGTVTNSTGVDDVARGSTLIKLPGCPLNVVNLSAVLVHYLTFNAWPPTDPVGRPLAAYGNLIHNQCERRPHWEFGEYATSWGDEGAQRGWCLYKLGCKGPETMANCPTVQYGEGLSWNVRAGAVCMGCVMPGFWDTFGPVYKRLPSPIPYVPALTVDTVGAAMVLGVGAVAGVHAVGMGARYKRRGRIAARQAAGGATIADATIADATIADEAIADAAGPAQDAPAPDAPEPVTQEGDAPTGTPGAPADH